MWRDGLSKETHCCCWRIRIGFLELVRSLVTDRLPFFISLDRLSVCLNGLVHLHCSILSSVLSDGILISSPDSLNDHLGSFRSTFRIGRWRREFLCFTHLSRVLQSCNLWFNERREKLIWSEKIELKKHSRKLAHKRKVSGWSRRRQSLENLFLWSKTTY